MPDAVTVRPTGLPPVTLREIVDTVAARSAAQPPRILDGDSAADGQDTVQVSGVSLNSAGVAPGDLFAAVPGSRAHGASFAADAVRAGAVAVMTDAAGAAMLRQGAKSVHLPVVVVEDVRALLGPVAARIYGNPSTKLRVIGVTGTSGKTTTCYMLEAALAAAGARTGLIGTVATRIDGQALASALTTPEAPDLQALFAVMVQRGVSVAAMEVSSHALALGRVDGTAFAAAAFTNLSRDHLDFHGDMEHYFAAKKLLFDGRATREIVVIDDDYGLRLAAERRGATTVSATGRDADWTGSAVSRERGVQRLSIDGPDGSHLQAAVGVPGAFNVANATTTIACAAAVGLDPAVAATGLVTVRVPGRMERVDAGQDFLAFVDYAHKPAALAAALDAARQHCTGRVIVVIGAGGDRDPGKRAPMGRIAADHAEKVIVTDDNPRTEQPAAIRAELLSGAGAAGGSEVIEIGDRAAAIARAVAEARGGDVVLVAGKGHEKGQIVGDVAHPFDDAIVLREAIDTVTAGHGESS